MPNSLTFVKLGILTALCCLLIFATGDRQAHACSPIEPWSLSVIETDAPDCLEVGGTSERLTLDINNHCDQPVELIALDCTGCEEIVGFPPPQAPDEVDNQEPTHSSADNDESNHGTDSDHGFDLSADHWRSSSSGWVQFDNRSRLRDLDSGESESLMAIYGWSNGQESGLIEVTYSYTEPHYCNRFGCSAGSGSAVPAHLLVFLLLLGALRLSMRFRPHPPHPQVSGRASGLHSLS